MANLLKKFLGYIHILPVILKPAFCDSEETWETEAFLQTRDRQRAWGGIYSRKAPQGPAPLQLETLPQRPCLVLMRAACPESGLLSPSASFLLVFTTAKGWFSCSLPLPILLLGGGLGSGRALW